MRIPQSTLHRWLAVLWLILLIPTLTIWRDSVLWVGIISVYANIVSHWGAAESSEAKEKITEA